MAKTVATNKDTGLCSLLEPRRLNEMMYNTLVASVALDSVSARDSFASEVTCTAWLDLNREVFYCSAKFPTLWFFMAELHVIFRIVTDSYFQVPFACVVSSQMG